jgi:hypothetical protein
MPSTCAGRAICYSDPGWSLTCVRCHKRHGCLKRGSARRAPRRSGLVARRLGNSPQKPLSRPQNMQTAHAGCGHICGVGARAVTDPFLDVFSSQVELLLRDLFTGPLLRPWAGSMFKEYVSDRGVGGMPPVGQTATCVRHTSAATRTLLPPSFNERSFFLPVPFAQDSAPRAKATTAVADNCTPSPWPSADVSSDLMVSLLPACAGLEPRS